MRRNEKVALVAGVSVGVGGGALGAFLAWTVGLETAHHFLDQCGDQYIELVQPPPSTARPTSDQPLPTVKEAVASARQAAGGGWMTSDQSLPQADAALRTALASRR